LRRLVALPHPFFPFFPYAAIETFTDGTLDNQWQRANSPSSPITPPPSLQVGDRTSSRRTVPVPSLQPISSISPSRFLFPFPVTWPFFLPDAAIQLSPTFPKQTCRLFPPSPLLAPYATILHYFLPFLPRYPLFPFGLQDGTPRQRVYFPYVEARKESFLLGLFSRYERLF